MSEDFGAYLKMLRQRAKLTQRDLAKELEVSPSAVGNWENGPDSPKYNNLQKLIEIFVRRQAFTPGTEKNEAERLWKLAQITAAFDTTWFGKLLNPAVTTTETDLLRRLHHIEEENRRLKEIQRQQDEELYRLKTQDEAGRKQEELRRQQEQAAQEAMIKAQSEEERLAAYRQALQADPRISQLKILSMSRPLNLENIYIRLRLHTKSGLSYELDPLLAQGVAMRDPNAHFRAIKHYRANRDSEALDPVEAICQYPKAVVLGDPGAGKTTLLKFLALQAAQGELAGLPDLPLHIELNRFARCAHSDLVSWAAQEWEERYLFPQAQARALLEKRLKNGQVLVLLDALDETVVGSNPDEAEQSYSRVAEAIEKFTTSYYLAPVVITARKAGYLQRPRLAGFTELEVLDFSEEDIQQFVKNWFADQPLKMRELTHKLQNNSRLETLAANPLLLSLIAIVQEQDMDLPERRAELYERCVEVLLKEWDNSRGLKRRREFPPAKKLLLLTEIAWHFHSKGQRYMHTKELLAEIANFLPVIGLEGSQSETILAEIAAENGLLKEQAHNMFGFLHLTLQEYFTALYVDKNNKLETLVNHLGDPWWEEVVLLYAGEVNDLSPLLSMLIGEGTDSVLKDDIFHSNLFLAGRCLTTRPLVRTPKLRTAIIEQLMALLRSEDRFFCEEASEVLTEIGGKDINNSLIALLQDDNLKSLNRSSLAIALGRAGDKSLLPHLLTLITDQSLDIGVLYSLISVIEDLGDKSLLPHLLTLITDQSLKPIFRRRVVTALRYLGDESLIPQLLSLLLDSSLNSVVRSGIPSVIGKLGNKSLIPELLPLLSDNSLDSSIRSEIGLAIGRFADKTITGKLLTLLMDETCDNEIRDGLIRAFSVIGDKSITPQLLTFFMDKTFGDELQDTLMFSLRVLGDKALLLQVLPFFLERKFNADVELQIAIAVWQYGDKSLTPVLLPILKDNTFNTKTREWVARRIVTWVEDVEDLHSIAEFLTRFEIFREFYDISHRLGVRIYWTDESKKQIRVVPIS